MIKEAASSSSSSIPEDQLGFTSASQIYSVRNVLSYGSVSKDMKDESVLKAFYTDWKDGWFLTMNGSSRSNKTTTTHTNEKGLNQEKNSYYQIWQ